MRKFLLIISVLVLSCTAKKPQDENYPEPRAEQDTVVAKKFLYVDTVEEAVTVTPPYDSSQTVVQAPVEDDKISVVADEEATQDTIEIDTTVYRWDLVVSADSVKEWKSLKSFAYVKNLDSLLKAAREKNKKQRKQQEGEHETVSYNRGGSSWLDAMLASQGLKIFLWVIAGAFVLFVIYKLFVTEGSLKRKPKTSPEKDAGVEEEIITPESDMDRLIREAVQQSAYRLAVRYHYLQSLHLLAEKGYVKLAADKTNYHYVHEITDYDRQTRFAGVTRNYEYVWYGEFEIDELIYHKLKTIFQSFNATL